MLRHGFLNSYHQTGLRNLMDAAIVSHAEEQGMEGLIRNYHKVDEIPFDFARRRMSVVVEDKNQKTQLITKGAIEEMLSVCAYTEFDGRVEPMTDEIRTEILKTVEKYNADGMRVLGIAHKTNPAPAGAFSVADESDMVLIGFLAFLDPPKESTKHALRALHEYGVDVKVLTGDNDAVTKYICSKVGIPAKHILSGADVERMDDGELEDVYKRQITRFALFIIACFTSLSWKFSIHGPLRPINPLVPKNAISALISASALSAQLPTTALLVWRISPPSR